MDDNVLAGCLSSLGIYLLWGWRGDQLWHHSKTGLTERLRNAHSESLQTVLTKVTLSWQMTFIPENWHHRRGDCLHADSKKVVMRCNKNRMQSLAT